MNLSPRPHRVAYVTSKSAANPSVYSFLLPWYLLPSMEMFLEKKREIMVLNK